MPPSSTGARSATGRRKKHGLGWVPWLALLLLIALAVGAYFVIREINDDDNDDNAGIGYPAPAALVYDVPATATTPVL